MLKEGTVSLVFSQLRQILTMPLYNSSYLFDFSMIVLSQLCQKQEQNVV